MKTRMYQRRLALIFLSTLNLHLTSVFAQSTAFTYQGRLTDAGQPANGLYDFRGQLYDKAGPPGDALVSITVTNSAVPVTNGLFVLTLDFGGAVFNGSDRWLLLTVRSNGVGSFTALQPRQQINPTPYALFAAQAGALPATVASTNKVANLNADLLDGLDSLAFVRKNGDTMTGTLAVNGPGGTATLSSVGSFFGNDIAVAGSASSGFGIGVSASSSGAAGYGVFGSATGTNGVGVYGTANQGPSSKGIYGQSSLGYAGYFQGAVNINFASPFSKPQLELDDPSDTGFTRLRMQTGTRPFWDIAMGGDNSVRFYANGNGDVMVLNTNGQLYVNVLTIRGGADIAEPFKMSDRDLPKGGVVVIDDEHPGQLKLSSEAYDHRVAGVISGAGGVKPGLSLHQQDVMDGDQHVALTGRVYVQADASTESIEPGDLLTTSSTPGYAMKVIDHSRAQGAVLGKAMTPLRAGKGLVLVLVTLQ